MSFERVGEERRWRAQRGSGQDMECVIRIVREADVLSYETCLFYNGEVVYTRTYPTLDGAQREAASALEDVVSAGWIRIPAEFWPTAPDVATPAPREREPTPPACPTCGSRQMRIVGQSGSPQVVHYRCEDCGHVESRALGHES